MVYEKVISNIVFKIYFIFVSLFFCIAMILKYISYSKLIDYKDITSYILISGVIVYFYRTIKYIKEEKKIGDKFSIVSTKTKLLFSITFLLSFCVSLVGYNIDFCSNIAIISRFLLIVCNIISLLLFIILYYFISKNFNSIVMDDDYVRNDLNKIKINILLWIMLCVIMYMYSLKT